MQPLHPPPEVKPALDEFESWGAVVEHVLFAAPPIVDVNAHQLAARSGLNTATHKKVDSPFEKWVLQRWPSAEVETDLSKLISERAESLTPAQFFGMRFDFATRKPLFYFPGTVFLHAYDDEAHAHLRRGGVSSLSEDWQTAGYAYTLLDPVFSLTRPTPWWRKQHPLLPLEVGASFLRLCDALFGDLETLEIYSWPTDCSNYFDPGHEWWGSFFWTVHAPSKNWLVTYSPAPPTKTLFTVEAL